MHNQYPIQQGNYARQGHRKTNKSERHMDHVHMSYIRLLPLLLKHSLVRLREPRSPPTLPPHGYNVNSICVFHSRAPGNMTEDCRAIKHLVQDLIDSKVIVFTARSEYSTHSQDFTGKHISNSMISASRSQGRSEGVVSVGLSHQLLQAPRPQALGGIRLIIPAIISLFNPFHV